MNDARPGLPSVAAFVILAALRVAAQESRQPDSRAASGVPSGALIALGKALFHDERLSGNLTMSCASCHRPELSFTDGRRHAVGQNGVSLGRNTPTLHGLGSIGDFPVGGSLGVLPASVDLTQRVLAPLSNGAEMNESVEGAILHLSYDKTVAPRFDAAFGTASGASAESAVTAARLATALTAYVRSLAPPPSRGMLALQSVDTPLSEPERRGLELFRGRGRCTTCHSGPGLADGRSHLVATFRRQRRITKAEDEGQASEAPTSRPDAVVVAGGGVVIDVTPAAESEGRVFEVEFVAPGPGSTYRAGNATFEPIERQTASLIDVRRTSPYFRDGSVATLDEAVRQHLIELREIGRDRSAIAANPALLLAGVKLQMKDRPGVVLTDSAKEQLASDAWIPQPLGSEEMLDLIAFLGSLSSLP